MKITNYWADDNILKIRIDSENQQESSELMEYANRMKSPIKVYGRVDRNSTWIWIAIPLKRESYKETYFGNDK